MKTGFATLISLLWVFATTGCTSIVKKMITIDGAGHNNISTAFKREYWGAISSFIEEEKLNAKKADASDGE